jgi:signal transduction histidine kinase
MNDENPVDIFKALLGVAVAIALPVVIVLSWGEGIVGPLASLLQWAASWPDSPKWGPCFALSLFFTLHHMLTVPLRLFTGSDNLRSLVLPVTFAVVDCCVFLLALQAVGDGRIDWDADKALLPVASRWGVIGYLAVISACGIVFATGLTMVHIMLVDYLLDRGSSQPAGITGAYQLAYVVVFHVFLTFLSCVLVIVIVGLLTFAAYNPFAPIAVLCFLAVSVPCGCLIIWVSSGNALRDSQRNGRPGQPPARDRGRRVGGQS